MHRILVDEKKWIDEPRFLYALNYCMLLPGPDAQQLATYVGWLLQGARGAILAGGLFILPGFPAILALSILYVQFQDTPAVTALFFGSKAAVLAIVIQAVLRVGSRVLKNRTVTAAVVSAIANLPVDLSLHTIFRDVAVQQLMLFGDERLALQLRWRVPNLDTLKFPTAALAAIAGAMLLGMKRSLAEMLLVCVGLGLAAQVLFGGGDDGSLGYIDPPTYPLPFLVLPSLLFGSSSERINQVLKASILSSSFSETASSFPTVSSPRASCRAMTMST